MVRRFPPAVFWLALLAVVFGLGYRLFAEMQPEDTGFVASSRPATARRPQPAGTHARPIAAIAIAATGAPSEAPVPSASPVAPHTAAPRPALLVPSKTLALAAQTPMLSSPHWVSDADFTYIGHWEHITKHYDGRTNGSSSRSFRPNSQAVLTFTGRSIRLYGIVGPGGGLGTVEIDGRVKRMVDFYSATKSPHKLVFECPPLEPGTHRLTLSVIPDQALPVERSHFVNIDGAEIRS